ncbi:hypothetical protein ABEG17_19280 [Pedococcus sp. KACC 23699]|uniref:Transcriptional regulator n=1 Tax=Pedococcus sp. KACC 23699 TaxID=3149228 RepID=A0AAU7JTU9_9MICO
MIRSWRWSVVVGSALTIAAVPMLLRVLPVGGGPGDAVALLRRVVAARGAAYSGYAESTGSLALPVGDEFNDTTTLLGGRTQLRVWWRGDRDWRVDTLDAAGERSLRVTPSGSWQWDFEDSRATRVFDEPPGAVRLPRTGDGLPPALAERLLSGATPGQAALLPGRRVAGRPADGLRIRPRDPLSSIDRIDVWSDRASGIPVSVDVYGRGQSRPALSTTFLDFAPGRPAAATTTFTPPPSARVRFDSRFDLIDALARFSPAQPPDVLRRYRRQDSLIGAGSVGLYGSGVTQIAVAALPSRRASSLERQLQLAAGAHPVAAGTVVTVGPVGLLLTRADDAGTRWLLTGTMTTEGLAEAADELLARQRAPS